MKRAITALKKMRLAQILTAFLAGVLLFVNTACSNAGVQASDSRQGVPAGLGGRPDPGAEVQAKNPRPEVPNNAATSSFKSGGMNDFSDVDPRTKSDNSEKAKALIDNAERNVIENKSAVGKTTERLGKNAEDLGKTVQRNTENVKNKAQGTAEDLTKGTKQGTQRATEDAAQDTKATGKNLLDNAKQAVENTADYVQGRVNETTKGTQRNLDKASEAID